MVQGVKTHKNWKFNRRWTKSSHISIEINTALQDRCRVWWNHCFCPDEKMKVTSSPLTVTPLCASVCERTFPSPQWSTARLTAQQRHSVLRSKLNWANNTAINAICWQWRISLLFPVFGGVAFQPLSQSINETVSEAHRWASLHYHSLCNQREICCNGKTLQWKNI